MKVSAKIFFMCMVFMNLEYFTYQQQTPEERCQSDGSFVCFDCFKSGTCVASGDTFVIEDIVECPTGVYCDDSLYMPVGPYGNCAPIPSSLTNCSCSSATTSCILDPNSPNVVLNCDGPEPVVNPPCPDGAVDLDACKCLSCSDACPLVDNPTDDCAAYFFCNGNDLIATTCPTPLCFDQDLCKCVDPTALTTTTSTTTTSTTTSSTTTSSTTTSSTTTTTPEIRTTLPNNEPTTTAAIVCTDDCPYADDPNDCATFYLCDSEDLTPLSCPGVLCFDQETCLCE